MSARLFDKYLENYAEPGIIGLDLPSHPAYEAFCVIPAYDEDFDHLQHFLAYSSQKKIAHIWVINCPDDADEDSKERTQALLKKLADCYHLTNSEERIHYGSVSDNTDLYLIDRCTEGRQISRKLGVGLARKLGMDLAIRLYARHTDNAVWIHSCDADVTLPTGYFDISAPEQTQAVSLYPFKHLPESGYEEAMALYDFKLRYYQRQLSLAGSPYAFHTIGSTIAATPLAYVQVRGMPKRSAGEDFYFLNKLAKVGSIQLLESPELLVAGRPSARVPFGTGPALIEIRDLNNAAEEYCYYHPTIFEALKGVLTLVESLRDYASVQNFCEALAHVMPDELATQTSAALEQVGFSKKYLHIVSGVDSEQIKARFHTWFDAFITLKFIHAMRDTYYSSLPLEALPEHVKVGILDVAAINAVSAKA